MTLVKKDAVAQSVAEMLLHVRAIKLSPDQPFKWSSGWNSPIYCDNRIALSFPEVRSAIKNALVDMIREEFGEVDAVVGVAPAGIPQGALVADALGVPFAYVRPEPKKHGMTNQIEGHLEAGQKVVVLEDLVSTGGSSLKAVEVLRGSGVNVVGMAAIFTYGLDKAAENFLNSGVTLAVLSNYDEMIKKALEKNYISADQVAALASWRIAPDTWGK
jgi:orotate phosphoribosyltransferase